MPHRMTINTGVGIGIPGIKLPMALTTTLYAMKVPSTSIKAYKAVVIILLVALSSPVVKQAFSRLQARMKGERPVVGKEAA